MGLISSYLFYKAGKKRRQKKIEEDFEEFHEELLQDLEDRYGPLSESDLDELEELLRKMND